MPIDPSELTPQERDVYNTLSSGQQQIYLDLTPEVRHIVGRWAPADSCQDAQKADGVCTPDPRVTAQVGVRKPTNLAELTADQKFSERVYKYRLKNARKGDLLLSPGGPSGVIGALLSALNPPQDYSHMGIVIEDDGTDGTVVRHCTTSEDWLNSRKFTTGTVFEGTPLAQDIPLHGFRSDAVRYLWPGTITQTVEIAFKGAKDELYRDEVYAVDNAGNFIWQNDDFGKPQKIVRERFAVADIPCSEDDARATGKSFLIHALTFDPVSVDAIRDTPAHIANPLIVQPCLLKETPRVRACLERIAEAAKGLRGHYRFFAYSDGSVGVNPDGPVTLEGVSEPYCSAGIYVTDPITQTRGMVCSSFIWTAAQMANDLASPKILLDGRPGLPEPSSSRDDTCTQLTKAHGRGRVPAGILDPVNPVDGQYFYGSTDRANAALALQKKLVDKVMENLNDFLNTVAGPPLLGAFFGGATGALISDLLAWNPALLAIVLGTSTAYIDGEVQKIRDTAMHLSNQLGDTFRSDNAAEDNESDDWLKNPGTGNAVSPDDIVNGWSAPHYEDDDRVAGLYGSNIVAEVLSPAPVEGKWDFTTWEISTDIAQVLVRVFYLDSSNKQVFLANALVVIGGCPGGILITKQLPDMSTRQSCGPIRTGSYYARATWT